MKLSVDKITHPVTESTDIVLNLARADLLHPLASGNKIYKLRPHLFFAKQKGVKSLLSFGGAFSNHIHALAMISEAEGFSSIGIIRGEPEYASNPTLSDAQAAGMSLEFVDRKTYKCRENIDYLDQLQTKYPDAYMIPEGGSSQLAIQGCALLSKEINELVETDVIAIACGTGATFSGVITGLNKGQSAIGYSVLKDDSLERRVKSFIDNECAVSPIDNKTSYHIESADFGGYAKFDESLLLFIIDWLDKTGILLDPIYTSKMCRRLLQQIEEGVFAPKTNITMIHTGGLQGWRGMKKQVIRLGGEQSWRTINLHLNKNKV